MNVEHLREFALSQPHATEDVKWGSDLCFCIGGKIFCVTGLEKASFSASFKVREAEFDELCSQPGISPAPYLARYKWVLADEHAALSEKEWKHYVRQSYELVRDRLPARLKGRLG